jgi:hypothetical protein
MEPITLIIIAVIAYLLYSSGVLSSFGIGVNPLLGIPPTTGVVAPPPALPVSATAVQQQLQTESAAAGGVSTALKLVPVAGPAISAAFSILTSTLLAASVARAKAAKTENSAVAAAVPGWDAAIAAIAAAFNNGSISYTQAQTAFAMALSNYWAEVTPVIQSGRNGCNGGASCPGVPNASSAQVTNEGGNNYCSGNIGAACCVGCADLNLSTSNLNWAVAQASKTLQTQSAFVQQVFASKYGGVNRAAYQVIFTPIPTP